MAKQKSVIDNSSDRRKKYVAPKRSNIKNRQPDPVIKNNKKDTSQQGNKSFTPFQQLRYEVEIEIWKRIKRHLPLIVLFFLLIFFIVACKWALGIEIPDHILTVFVDHILFGLFRKV